MPISVRFFIVPETGPLRHVPMRIADALPFQADALPEFAGTRQRVVTVILDNEAGRPVRMLDARGSYWTFAEDGRMQLDHDWVRFGFDPPKPTTGKIVDLRPQIERAQWKARSRWEVTADDLDRIVAAIWPGSGPAADAVKVVTGRAPRRPPLTSEAREALRKFSEIIDSLDLTIAFLSEPALKGLAFEARRHAESYETEEALWTALAGMADRRRTILAQRRTGKGIWYAVIRVWLWKDDHRHETREIATVEERCEGKAAAEVAARWLLAENAHRLAADVTVEAEVLTELEWAPIRREPEE